MTWGSHSWILVSRRLSHKYLQEIRQRMTRLGSTAPAHRFHLQKSHTSLPPAFSTAPPMATVASCSRRSRESEALLGQRGHPSGFSRFTSTPALATCAPGPAAHARIQSQTVGGVGTPQLFLSARNPASRDPGVTPRRKRGAGGGRGAQAPRGEWGRAGADGVGWRRPSALPWRSGDRLSLGGGEASRGGRPGEGAVGRHSARNLTGGRPNGGVGRESSRTGRGPGRGGQRGPCSPDRFRWWSCSAGGDRRRSERRPATLPPPSVPTRLCFQVSSQKGGWFLGKLDPRTPNSLPAPQLPPWNCCWASGKPFHSLPPKGGCCLCSLKRRKEKLNGLFTD